MSASSVIGYVIHRYPYSESSQVLRVFSLEEGLLSLLARGARRSKNNSIGCLEPFYPLCFNHNGKGQLPRLLRAESGQGLVHPVLEGNALFCGLYLNELILNLLKPGHAMPTLFTQYSQTLAALEHPPYHIALRQFEITLLNELGIWPDLAVDSQGITVDTGQFYRLDQYGVPVAVAPSVPDAHPGIQLLALSNQQFELAGVLPLAQKLVERCMMQVDSKRGGESRALYQNFLSI